MNNVIIIELEDESATGQWAAQMSGCVQPPCVIGLSGELGVGKTTLIRALLRALGITGAIKSPTYALVETYDCQNWQVHHFDLYRIAHEEELAFIGFRDYVTDNAVCFIEWPSKTQTAMAVLDVLIDMTIKENGRMMTISAKTERGEAFIHCLRGQR
ncbi:tRNA (adenosine(37)-N6)-threonylcarbamoyltransferase complex ATPase subunit type 1 TsaE [Legionella sp. W05-934-2]|jgi:tRNA threonylcarbamoyladenosine biosynthesis protein TsaE|uniref:tRNA (adenosine(37)-N6)-threonylcarbamoyltransferase complex ATPase subunit type 1 TsaE n=1 Tax=Legionella sp. W05-934-2 TaxID=1198649 RepID=UPI003463482E